MRRRTYIMTLASGVGLTAGCASDDGGGGTPTPSPEPTPTETPTPSPEPTPTESPTPTETPKPSTPQVEAASLIWNGDAEGAIEDKTIETAGAGGHQYIGVRTLLRVNHDKLTPKFTVDVEDSTGTSVASQSVDATFDAPDADYTTEPFWVRIDVSDLGPGRYTGVVTATDAYQGRTSESKRFDFELLEPLTPREITLVDSAPNEATAGEAFQWILTLENRTAEANTIVGDLAYSPEDANYSRTIKPVSWSLPAASQVRYPTRPLRFEPGSYELSVSEVEIDWETTVTETPTDEG